MEKISKLEKISIARIIIMGFAILWIVFFHTTKLHFNLPVLIKFPIFLIGYGGVDIFVFLSGFGIYCSLDKNSDNLSFFIKRLKRLFPTIPIICLYILSIPKVHFHQIIGYLTTQNFWIPNFANDLNYGRFWYISAILLFYFVSPILFDIIKKHFTKKTVIILVLISFLLTIPYLKTLQHGAISRFPIYVIGMIFGYCYCNNINLSKKFYYILYILSFMSFIFLISAYLFWKKILIEYCINNYLFIFIAIGLCVFISEIYHILKKYKFANYIFMPFNFLGKYTLEIYLIEAYILALSLWKLPFVNPVNRVFISIFAGIFYSIIFKYVLKIFSKLPLKNLCGDINDGK